MRITRITMIMTAPNTASTAIIPAYVAIPGDAASVAVSAVVVVNVTIGVGD